MRITIDTEAQVLQLTDGGEATECSLYSPEAFQILSRQWIVLGWNLGHWSTFSWMGRQLLQLPDDVLRLAELFWNLRPDVIVETGVYDGGSTLLFASICRLYGAGRVISIEREFRPGVREAIRQAAGDQVMLIEGDSASPAELRLFGPLVSQGCYLIVADSICPDLAHTPQGESTWSWDHPGKAVDEFLARHPEFSRERPPALFPGGVDFTQLSYFPSTWLRRR
jgi:cephalosporin hydroxylase